MPTLTLIDGFEYGVASIVSSTINGGGVGTAVTNGVSCDSTVKRTGGYSLKVVATAGSNCRLVKTITAIQDSLVGSFYFRVDANPTAAMFIMDQGSGPRAEMRVNTDGTLSGLYNGGTAQTTAGSVCDGAWHLIDFRSNTSANPYLLDWAVDGVAQTQAVRTVAAADQLTFSIGQNSTTPDGTFYIDDLVLSATAADYPIGAHSVLTVFPTSDGTHVNTNSGMEDNAGTNISTTTHALLSTVPATTTTFLRQSVIGTSDYAEVLFDNHSSSMSTIWDATCYLGYASSSNAVNEGATIVSFDNFSTFTDVYGNPTTRGNHQTAAAAVAYKVATATTSQGVLTRPGGGWTTTDFDNLKARMGYSNDVTGNPRWNGLMIQYAGPLDSASGETVFVGRVPI